MTNTPLQAKIAALGDLLASIEDDRMPEPLDRLQALRMIAETAESALSNAVDEARAADWSWTAVGRALGTTRQGAHQRFGGGA